MEPNANQDRTGEAGRAARRRTRSRACTLSAIATCVAAAVLAAPAPPTAPPSQLVIAPEVSARLDVLATGLHREIVLCLIGRVRGDTAHGTRIFMPVPHASTPTEVVTGPCPRGTVATWHNHPSAARAGRGADARRPKRALGGRQESWGAADHSASCRPSGRDLVTALRLRIPFLVIADGAGTHCVHSLDRLEALAD